MYPIFLEMRGKKAVVIGGGGVALRKLQALLDADARVVVVAEHFDQMIEALCEGKDAKLIKSRYDKIYLVGATVAIAATSRPEVNRRIYNDCQVLEILCNVVDEPELCDFFVPAVLKRAELQIAIGTEGHCPAYAGRIRRHLEKEFTEEHGRFLSELGLFRRRIIKELPDPGKRKALLGKLVDEESFEYFVKYGAGKWRDFAEELISKESSNFSPSDRPDI